MADEGTVSEIRMRIRVNGQSREVPANQTVAELLDDLGVDCRTVVVELNRQIVRRTELLGVRLEPNDQLELVQFVGGG